MPVFLRAVAGCASATQRMGLLQLLLQRWLLRLWWRRAPTVSAVGHDAEAMPAAGGCDLQ